MTDTVEAAIEAEIEMLRARLADLETALAALRRQGGAARGGQPKTERILSALADAPDGMTRAELSDALSMRGSESLLSSALAHLKRTGRVRRSDEGRWSLPQ